MKTFLLTLLTGTLALSSWAADLSNFKTADELWKHIQKLQRGPTEKPSPEKNLKAVQVDWLAELDGAAADFIKRFPDDARRWDARQLQAQVIQYSGYVMEKEPDAAAAEKILKEIADAPNAPAAAKADAQSMMIDMHADNVAPGNKEGIAGVDAEIAAFLKNYPDDERKNSLQLTRAKLYEQIDPVKSESILTEAAKTDDKRVAFQANQQLQQLQLKKKPVELSFTAVDGTKVDLAKMRGKVVLVDFWATWCGPCIGEIPNVVATYKKLHDKGFEIVGISLDKDKDRLASFTKDKGMTWVQYFDGKVWENEISSKYGIMGIPAMWVLDKKGMIRSTNARGSKLGKLVEDLLAE